MEGFCMKCRAKRTMVDTQEQIFKNKRRAMVGRCSVCGTKMVTFLKK